MKTELTLNVLQTMSAQEYEDIRAAGSDERRELTHAVMRELDAPDNWTMNGEYGSEFGGFFPVQVRFTPAHERFHLALCSPGDVSQVWVLVLVNAGGEPFAKRRCALHPGGLLPGCQERRPRRDRGGATGTVAASRGFCVRDGSPPGRRQLRWLRSRQPAPPGGRPEKA